MNEVRTEGAEANVGGVQVSLQSVYLKDCSYESPNGPRLPNNQGWEPKFQLNMNTSAEELAADVREVLLTVTLEAKQGEATLYLVEVKQAGVVSIRARGHFRPDRQRRLSEFSSAFGQLRRAVCSGIRSAAVRFGQLGQGLTMPIARQEPIAVIGAGSWGTALAVHLARAGHPTHLWGRDPAQLDAMHRARCNERYLPDAAFPETLVVAADLRQALDGVRDALVAVPSHAFRDTLKEIERHLGRDTRIAWATKGFEISTGLLPHQVAGEILGSRPGAVLSDPTFAKEVSAGVPTAMTVASRDDAFAKALASRLSGPNFRAYMQSDIMGVEVGGAVKNVIAIGSGIADGMGFGANTRVALITRGLAEMMRLGVKLGA